MATRKSDASVAMVEPLSEAALSAVPGVLGKIAMERRRDYLATSEFFTAQHSSPVTRRGRSFIEALSAPGLAIIAEVKRRSPSQGAIADVDPLGAARAYVQGGAHAISVLTEPRHFGGALEHLERVAAAVNVPVLRKDFVVHPAQVAEAAAAGARAVLLIVALLKEQTTAYLSLCHESGLEALVEVHDETELALAMNSGADVIGINNRDLTTLEVDLAVAPRLIRAARGEGFQGLLVAESGYRGRAELAALEGLADAVLVGTSVAQSGDLAAKVKELAGG